MKRVTTETGSVYLIDEENKTWERVSTEDTSGKIRTSGGSIKNNMPLYIKVGHPLTIWTDTINLEATHRVLCTSNVIVIEDHQLSAKDLAT